MTIHKVRLPEEGLVQIKPGEKYELMFGPARWARIVGMLPIEGVDCEAFRINITINGKVQLPPTMESVALVSMLTGPLSSGYRTHMIPPWPAGTATLEVFGQGPFAVTLLVQEPDAAPEEN